MGDGPEERPTVAEDVRKKISEGMKRSHANRKKQKKVTVSVPSTLVSTALRQLIEERDALNVAIKTLQRRGL